MIYLDAHTHHLEQQPNSQRIYNVVIPSTEEELAQDAFDLPDGWFSVGIHPWYIQEALLPEQLHWLRRLAKHPRCKFIGETGLDRLQGPPLPLQEAVLMQHIQLANELQKPLVLHCVRCFQEIIAIKKVKKPRVPMLLHGFASKAVTAILLHEKGFYFSFGKAILSADSAARHALAALPLGSFLLETDDADTPIEAIYEAAAAAKEIAVTELLNDVWDTYALLQLPA